MGLRIFAINRDGSYNEVPPAKESLLHRGEAFIIVDRKEKNIYIYRKAGISSALAYSAGRAATNLNTRKGSKYKVVNIEQEDKEKILSYILDKLESKDTVDYQRITEQVPKTLTTSSNYVYGEKVREKAAIKKETYPEETMASVTQVKEETSKISETYEMENVAKALAGKILFEISIEHTKSMKKPPRYELRAELIKKIDKLLDSIY